MEADSSNHNHLRVNPTVHLTGHEAYFIQIESSLRGYCCTGRCPARVRFHSILDVGDD